MLDALVIRNFRCLQDFHVSRLGRVNLIVGRNNAGKSTVLDALRIHAGRAGREVLESITQARDESLKDLFPGHSFPTGDDWSDAIQIGDPTDPASMLRLLHAHVSDTEEQVQAADGGTTVRITTRRVPKQDLARFPGRTEQALFVLLQDRPRPRSSWIPSVGGRTRCPPSPADWCAPDGCRWTSSPRSGTASCSPSTRTSSGGR